MGTQQRDKPGFHISTFTTNLQTWRTKEDHPGARYPVCSPKNWLQASLGYVVICLETRLSPAHEDDDDDDDDDR